MDGYNFLDEMRNNIGQTVTIFTTSGGQSGRGFTGVLTMVNPSFVRLVTNLGPAPGCALGNCCERNFPGAVGRVGDDICVDENNYNDQNVLGAQGNNYNNVQGTNLGGQGRASCRANTLGSVVDIPVNRIASFVHNAVGGGW